MKFITEEKKEEPTFRQVEFNQFFISQGYFYQKVGEDSANRIANNDGQPDALSGCSFDFREKIDKICPKVIKIEF